MKELINEWKQGIRQIIGNIKIFFKRSPGEGKSPFSQWLSHVKKHITNRSMPYFWVGCGTAFLLLFGVFLQVNTTAPVMSFGVLEAKDTYFAAAGYFDITGVSGIETEYIEEHLELSPSANFTVTRRGENTVRISVKRYKNQPYTVSLLLPGGKQAVEFLINEPYLQVEQISPATIQSDDCVVLSFSEPVSWDSLMELIEISPAASVYIEVDGSIAYLYPATYWSPGSRYTLTFDEQFVSESGLSLRDTTTVSWRVASAAATTPSQPTEPQTPSLTTSFHYVEPQTSMLRADAPLTWEFSAQKLPDNVPVAITTYRLDTVEKYRDQAGIFEAYNVSLDMLERVESNVYLVKDGTNILSAPNPGLGAYISEITYIPPGQTTEKSIRQAFLVTDLSVYMQSSGSQALLWLNDYTSGQTLPGYQISLLGDSGQELASGTTSSLGVALMSINFAPPEDEEYAYYGSGYYGNTQINITDPAGNLVYADSSYALSGSYDNSRDRYYSYFYLDRGIYKPTDTISFWGFVQPHHQNTGAMPDSVFVNFDPDGLNIEMEVALDAYGTFSGEIQLEDLLSSQYYIGAELHFPEQKETGTAEVLDEEQDASAEDASQDATDSQQEPAFYTYHLDNYYIDVKEYEKPTYVLSSSTNQNWYTSGQQVSVTATPTFYDGTPLPNFRLEYQTYNPANGQWGDVQTVMTDEKGTARFSFPVFQGKTWVYNNNYMETGRYMIRIVEDGENITHTASYYYVPTDVVYNSALERGDDGNLQFWLTAYHTLPWSQLDQTVQESFDGRPARLSGEHYEGLEANIEYHWWGGYDNGSYQYDSDSGSFKYQTGADGSIQIEDVLSLLQMNKEWDYYEIDFQLELTDGLGNTLYQGYYYWNGQEAYGPSRSGRYQQKSEDKPAPPAYSLFAYNSAGEDVTGEYYDYMYYDTTTFGAGESMRFDLQFQGEPVTQNGYLLYTLIQDGVASHGVVQGTSLTLTQTARNSPSVNLTAAYFDGKEVHPVRSMMINFDRESLKVDLEVTASQTSYRPGDTVQLQVKATDQQGSGVGGNLLISVVDEAIFALKEQNINILSTLHGDIYYDNEYVRKYSTATGDYTLDGRPGDEGKGGGEGIAFYDSYRSNFKDTAAFLPVRTDSGGNATVQFQLPDNTTSWRVTTLSVGDALQAGQRRDNLISSLPFFISPVISPKYIVGDDIAILVQGHGTLLDDESEIEYTVTITGDGVNETLESQGTAYESQQINFGQLPMGEYTVVATARYSGYSDTVELPLAVINSNLELVIHKKLNTAEELAIQAVRYPVVITFYDEANEAFFDSIGSLMGHYCMVANQRMSRFVAKRALEDRMDPVSIPQYILEKGNDSASNMQNADGGIGWTVGSPSEPVLTAKVLLVAIDQFDHSKIAGYFRGVLESSKDDMELAAAYLGLAAIGEPVAEEIIALLEDEDSKLSTSAAAYLIAGLAYLEDSNAEFWYNELLAGQVRNMNAGIAPKLFYKDIPAIWIAASKIAPDDADAISSFLAKSTWRYDTLFECMIYVTNYDRAFTPRTISYETNGVTHNISLGLQGQYSVTLTKSEFESLVLLSIPEGVNAMAYYVGEPGELGLEPSEHFDIAKTVEDMGDGHYKFTVKMHFASGAPTGQYDISDWVPSNMRLYTVEQNKSEVSYTEEGQKLYFTLYRNSLDSDVEIVYYARQTYDTQAVVDSVYIIHGDSGENASTEKFTLQP